MPHMIIEYSANLEGKLDVQALMHGIREAIIASEVFPLAGLKIRAIKHDEYLLADGNPDNAFIHLLGYILPGRTMEAKKKASDLIFKALTDVTAPLFDEMPLGISLDIQEMSAELNQKKKNINV